MSKNSIDKNEITQCSSITQTLQDVVLLLLHFFSRDAFVVVAPTAIAFKHIKAKQIFG